MITNGTVQLINVGRCAEAFPRQAAALKGNQLSMIGTVITIDIHIHIYTYITLHLSNTVCIYIYIYIYTYIYTYNHFNSLYGATPYKGGSLVRGNP